MISQNGSSSNETKKDKADTNPGVIKRFEQGVDRVYEMVDAFYHKYHIVVDVIFLTTFIVFVSAALLVDCVREVSVVLNYKFVWRPVLFMDKYILPTLAGLALLFDIKDKKIRYPAFFALFLLALYQPKADNSLIAFLPHTNVHYFGAGCLIVAAAGQKWKRIGWTYVITCSFWMILVTVLSLTGVVPDLVFSPELGGRHALGMHYPLNWAAHWFSIALVYCMLKKGILHIVDYIILVVLFLVALLACRAKTSTVLYLALIVGTAIRQFVIRSGAKRTASEEACEMENEPQKEVAKSNHGSKEISSRRKKLFTVFVFSFWIMAILMVVMTVFYVPPFSTFLSHIPGIETLRSRLYLNRVGLTNPDWFPTKFGYNYPTRTWNGTVPAENYFFIDCSYIMILIRSGVIVFSIMMADLLWVPYRLFHAKEKYALMILSLFAVICAMEHHILDLSFDPFLLLSFSLIGSKSATNALEDLIRPIRNRFSRKDDKGSIQEGSSKDGVSSKCTVSAE